jgi:molybdopterin converting factor subunit 1
VSVEVVVKFFASAAEAAGTRQRVARLEAPTTVKTLLDGLCAEFPKLARLRPALRVAVNREYAAEEAGLSDGDEVALIPPVSGGRVRRRT